MVVITPLSYQYSVATVLPQTWSIQYIYSMHKFFPCIIRGNVVKNYLIYSNLEYSKLFYLRGDKWEEKKCEKGLGPNIGDAARVRDSKAGGPRVTRWRVEGTNQFEEGISSSARSSFQQSGAAEALVKHR